MKSILRAGVASVCGLLLSTGWCQGITDAEPQLASDGAGNIVAVWLRPPSDGTSPGALYSVATSNLGTTWTAPLPLTTATDKPASADVTYAGDGTWIAIWSDQDADAVYAMRSTNNGHAWGAPERIDFGAALQEDAQYLEVKSDQAGTVTASWFAKDLSAPQWVRQLEVLSTDGGETWTYPTLTGEVFPLVYVASALSPGGNWYKAQVEYGSFDTSHTLRLRYSDNLGITWATTDIANALVTTDYVNAHSIHVNGDTIVIAWGNENLFSDRDHSGDKLYISTSLDAGATWDTKELPWTVPSNWVIRLAANNAGDYVALANRVTAPDLEYDLLSYNSSDPGTTWSQSGVITAEEGVDETRGVIISDGEDFMVLYQYLKPGTNPYMYDPGMDIRASRSYDGGASWEAVAFPISESSTSAAASGWQLYK